MKFSKNSVRFQPRQAARCAALSDIRRDVLAAYPTLPATFCRHPVDQVKQVGPIEFTRARFVTQRHIGNLKVPHIASGQITLDFGGDIAFHNLAVKQVHLDFEVGLAHLRQNCVCMILSIDKKARNAARVDGLGRLRHAGLGGAESMAAGIYALLLWLTGSHGLGFAVCGLPALVVGEWSDVAAAALPRSRQRSSDQFSWMPKRTPA